MAVLSDQRRAAATAELMEQLSGERELHGTLLKPDFRPAINALDDFMNTNGPAIKALVPQPARGILTNDQLARALTIVVAYRYIDKA